jgi:hypothetical protein
MQRVKLIKEVKNSDIKVGTLGKVIEITKGSKYPYKVKWANDTITSYTSLSKTNFEIIGEEVGKKNRKRNKKKKFRKNKGRHTVAPAGPVHGQGQIFGVTNVTPRRISPADDSWEVDLDIVENCSKACTNGATIWIKPLAKVKIDALMEEYPRREWLGYLLGDKETNTVDDIFIPEQVATAARVDDIECDEFNDLPVIGVIHSHHNMGTGFSHTDHTYINQNHDISLVVATSGIDGQIRHRVPCGALKISDVDVRMAFDIDWDKEKFIEKAKANINYTRTVNQQNWYPNQTGWAQEGKVPPGAQKSPYGFYFNGKWCSTVPTEITCPSVGCWNRFKAPKYKIDDGTAGKCPDCTAVNKLDADKKIDDTIRDLKEGEKKTLAQMNQEKIEEAWNTGDTNLASFHGEEHTCPKCTQVWIYTAGEMIQCPNCDDDNLPDEWTTGKEAEMGNYLCGRCKGQWMNVNLNVFKCPNCDRDTEEKSLEQELQMLDASMSEGSDIKNSCRICKKPTRNPNTVHVACLEAEKNEVGNAMANGGSKSPICDICGKAVRTDGNTHYKCLKKQEYEQTQPII